MKTLDRYSLFRFSSKWEEIVCLLIFLMGMLGGEVHAESSDPQVDSEFRIEVTRDPVFPRKLSELGIMEGTVRVLVAVDASGDLYDWIVMEGTHRDFGNAVEKVIEDWRFIPRIEAGVPQSSTVYVDVKMRIDGVVVSNPSMVSVMINHFDLPMIPERDRLKVYSVRDLDEIPVPIYVERPVVPESLIADDDEAFVFEFFIDSEGEVHLPLLVGRENLNVDERILVIVQESLRKWRFSPPTVNGRKVTVKVAQPFDF